MKTMLKEKIDTYIEEVDMALKKFIFSKCPRFCDSFFSAMNYSLFSGGKRLRPIFTLAVCEALGYSFKRAVPFACAVEMVHTGSLIHDDLPAMDDDEIRRNKPTCHVKYGEINALLAGDGFFLSAFEILTFAKNVGLEDFEIVTACRILSKMAGSCGMVGGQAMEFFIDETSLNKSEENLSLIFENKTSAMFRAACSLGAVSGKANEFEKKSIDEFAKFFGLAFQIRDDILDFSNAYEPRKKENINLTNYACRYGLNEAKKALAKYRDLSLLRLLNFSKNEFLVELTKHSLNF